MNMRILVQLDSLVIIGVVLSAAPMAAVAYTGQELASGAKVSIDQARAIALKAVPGKVTDQELEKENGGSGLRYSFDIKRGATTHEVGVDAQTGAVLENKAEGPSPINTRRRNHCTTARGISCRAPIASVAEINGDQGVLRTGQSAGRGICRPQRRTGPHIPQANARPPLIRTATGGVPVRV